jgi:hypothetical protein
MPDVDCYDSSSDIAVFFNQIRSSTSDCGMLIPVSKSTHDTINGFPVVRRKGGCDWGCAPQAPCEAPVCVLHDIGFFQAVKGALAKVAAQSSSGSIELPMPSLVSSRLLPCNTARERAHAPTAD